MKSGTIVRLRWAAGLGVLILSSAGVGRAQEANPVQTGPRKNWDFKFKDFVIGAWWGPGATDAEMKYYKEAGFNVVMSGRYMQLAAYGNADEGIQELDLARKYGLGVMFDTYTKNDRPWGGKTPPKEEHPNHHPASLAELQWLYGKLGRHPALIGFMIGDDQGEVSPRAAECTAFLHAQPGPKLMPWLCGWIAPKNLAAHNNPIENPQIYPSLYNWQAPAQEQARQYAASYASVSRQCRDLGVLFWPMFNATHDTNGKTGQDMFGYCPSASLLRFPAYAALAYGAEGIWYFTYNGGALENLGHYTTDADARRALTPLYPVAKQINRRIAAWGPHVLGRTSTGLFGTAFGMKLTEWPFPEETTPLRAAESLAPPGPGKLIETMSGDLLAGILTKSGQKPLVVVVDCRTSKAFDDLPARRVTVRFAAAVTQVRIIENGKSRVVKGNIAPLTLKAGEGRMLELEGNGLDSLCSTEAIYAAPTEQQPATRRRLTASDWAGIKAARLRIDVFGSDAGPQFTAKYIDFNGHRLGTVPANGSDAWSLTAIAFRADQLAWIRPSNQVIVRTECADAWKFRNIALAVQLADGTWVKTDADATVHSSPNWANSEGKTWGKDGAAGPIPVAF